MLWVGGKIFILRPPERSRVWPVIDEYGGQNGLISVGLMVAKWFL